MGSERDRDARVPLLEPVELGSRETDLSPGIGTDLRPVLRPGERVLLETRSFPTIATLDDDGQVDDTFISDGGGTTTFTDRRLIFVRDALTVAGIGSPTASDSEFVPLAGYDPPPAAPPVVVPDTSAFAPPGSLSVAPGPSVTPMASAVTIVAGHVRWSTVTALSYHHQWRLTGSLDVFYLSTRSSSSTLLIATRVRRASGDLCPRIVESISIGRRVEIPTPAGRPDGSMNWVF